MREWVKDKLKIFLLAISFASGMLLSAGAVHQVCAESIDEATADTDITPTASSEHDELAAWTVLFYFCGSDLESRYKFATGNLTEIRQCEWPEKVFSHNSGNFLASAKAEPKGKVNVVIETGGAKEWHSAQIGMNVDVNCLQRWTCEPVSEERPADATGGFVLQQSLPLASMADPETLADFIRWSAETYPAQKYALVLWDHGGGSKSGIFIDELFNEDMMYLHELDAALSEGGVFFETVLFDACMMANLETACIIDDYARWMVASEEVVAGKGTAIGSWLQELMYSPQCDGKRLGRNICDLTQVKYANSNDTQAGELLTWSVIDLSKIEAVSQVFDRFFKELNEIYVRHPEKMSIYANCIIDAEEYGTGEENMLDIADIFFNEKIYQLLDADLRQEILNALEKAVVYNIRGMGRCAARGLSFCFAPDFDNQELEIYSKNCPSDNYLALLDALSPWTAPDELYEKVERLPEINTMKGYEITIKKRISDDGIPGISFISGYYNVYVTTYCLYQLNEDTGELICLGSAATARSVTADGKEYRRAKEPWMWPAIEGNLCSIKLIDWVYEQRLYEIPIQIGPDIWNFRCGYDRESGYTIYGVWEGVNYDTGMFNRNVKSLAQLAGLDYRLLYPIGNIVKTNQYDYEQSELCPMFRSLEVTEVPLPEGTYLIQYNVEDMFFHQLLLDPVVVTSDGQEMRIADENSWSGTVSLRWNGY
ncbi:MAG: hypothetical protein IKE58_12550 [Blautia sp.]|nr:hypothetical protein [Blautia sp.]